MVESNQSKDPNDFVDLGRGDIRNSATSYNTYAGNPEKILEIGSGDGRFTKELMRLAPNAQIEVIDIDEEFMAKCREATSNKLTYHVASAHDLPEVVKAKKYDVIWIQGLAQYFPDAQFKEFLESLKNILSPNGKIFLKEQFNCGKTVYVKDSYIRSLRCFEDAFGGYSVTMDNIYSFDKKYYSWITFVLEHAGEEEKWSGNCHRQCDCYWINKHFDCRGKQ